MSCAAAQYAGMCLSSAVAKPWVWVSHTTTQTFVSHKWIDRWMKLVGPQEHSRRSTPAAGSLTDTVSDSIHQHSTLPEPPSHNSSCPAVPAGAVQYGGLCPGAPFTAYHSCHIRRRDECSGGCVWNTQVRKWLRGWKEWREEGGPCLCRQARNTVRVLRGTHCCKRWAVPRAGEPQGADAQYPGLSITCESWPLAFLMHEN
jgi:hypothetical protein